MSRMLGRRTKENPGDAKLNSHKLLVRAGFIRQVSNGIYSTLLPAQKVISNIESIVRTEMNSIDGQEVEMPLVQPKELWEESGRYQAINDELVRLKDRNDHEMVLAMTHEEAAVNLARGEAISYKDYPFTIYQFAKKFRDEARPRGGLIRVKEFTMKDAYSFHTNQKDLESYYSRAAVAYSRIFARTGIPEVVAIKSDSGMMGGNVSHEYMLLTEGGEDTIITCPECDYKANKEVAVSSSEKEISSQSMQELSKIYTPNISTIDELAERLNLPKSRFLKTIFYKPVKGSTLPIAVMIRGDIEVNDNKLAKIIGSIPEFADNTDISEIGAAVGFASGFGIEDKCVVIADKSIENEINLITGANEKDYHLANFNFKRDMPNHSVYDVATVRQGDTCKYCGAKLEFNRGIEVGNIFQLGTKYTEKMNMRYADENGHPQTPIMGCYGIGIGRLMASIAEKCNDDKGLVWPVTVAPWKASIITLSSKKGGATSQETSQNLYEQMRSKGLDVLWDDREVSAGEKFADADLLGIPLQFVVSPRNIENGVVEWKKRASGEKGFVEIDKAVEFASEWIKAETEILNTFADNVKPLPQSEISNSSAEGGSNIVLQKLISSKHR